MHRFFATRLNDTQASLSKEEAAHALKVLRLSPGDCCQALMDGNAELAEQLAVRHVEMARENILNTAQADPAE